MLIRSCENRHLLPCSKILEERVFENVFLSDVTNPFYLLFSENGW